MKIPAADSAVIAIAQNHPGNLTLTVTIDSASGHHQLHLPVITVTLHIPDGSRGVVNTAGIIVFAIILAPGEMVENVGAGQGKVLAFENIDVSGIFTIDLLSTGSVVAHRQIRQIIAGNVPRGHIYEFRKPRQGESLFRLVLNDPVNDLIESQTGISRIRHIHNDLTDAVIVEVTGDQG